MKKMGHTLRLKRLGLDTYHEAIIYMREDCHVCHSEGFEAQARIQVTLGQRSIIATLNRVTSELLKPGEASLSNYAWDALDAQLGDEVQVAHPQPLDSLGYIHDKIDGNPLSLKQLKSIITDVLSGRLSDVQIAAFLAASATGQLNKAEIVRLTQAMIESGDRLTWPYSLIVDKHCVGAFPGIVPLSLWYPFLLRLASSSPKHLLGPLLPLQALQIPWKHWLLCR